MLIMRKYLITILVLVVLAGLAYRERSTLRSYFNLRGNLANVSIPDELRKPLEDHGLLPEPLRAQEETSGATLTRSGTIRETNAQRAKYGLKPLSENAKLDQAATIKLQDMFAKQYFEH